MAKKKIDSNMIDQMVALYEKFKTYSAVSKELGISASTVSKYIKQRESIKTFNSYIGPEPIEYPEKDKILGFSSLSKIEQDSLTAFIKEL